MNTLSTEDLKKYLKMAVELEQRVYVQKNMLSRINSRINSLGIAGNRELPEKPQKGFWENRDTETKIWYYLLLPLPCVLFLFIGKWGENYTIGYNNHGILESVLDDIIFRLIKFISPVFKFLGIFMIIGTIIIWVGSIVSAHDTYKDRKQEYYDKSRQIAKDKVRVEAELKEKAQLTEIYKELNAKHRQTKNLLSELYSLGIIYGKYRSFVAVCSFYEYLMSGRCKQLEGHEGAYNIFENEIRLDIVINKLDDVLSHLDRIEQNQYLLYNEIKNGNRTVKNLTGSISDLKHSLDYSAEQNAIAAQNSRWAAEELNTIKWLEILRSR